LLISPELVAPGIWQFADRNRAVLVEGAQRAYNPARLAAEGRLVSVNSALLVDLLGQVASEGIGPRATGSVGGGLDFAVAAQLSGGHSVIALASTFSDGSSRIVASMPLGTPISIPSQIPDYIVTEFGIAALRGLDRTARGRAIAALAHPKHRDALEAEAAAAGY
jgi:acyl-CoA hydrolase